MEFCKVAFHYVRDPARPPILQFDLTALQPYMCEVTDQLYAAELDGLSASAQFQQEDLRDRGLFAGGGGVLASGRRAGVEVSGGAAGFHCGQSYGLPLVGGAKRISAISSQNTQYVIFTLSASFCWRNVLWWF